MDYFNRFHYYFKELLVDFFFIPTFFKMFRNHPRLPEATRLRIQKLATEMGYTPDPFLRALVSYRGRVMAAYSMFWGLSPIGGLLAGFLATYVGVQWAVAINGLLVLVYVPYLWLGTPMRRID